MKGTYRHKVLACSGLHNAPYEGLDMSENSNVSSPPRRSRSARPGAVGKSCGCRDGRGGWRRLPSEVPLPRGARRAAAGLIRSPFWCSPGDMADPLRTPAPPPASLPIAPTEEAWRAMTPADRERFLIQVNDALSDP